MRRKQLGKEVIDGNQAHARHKRIISRELQRRALFLENVKDLVEMFETQQYKAILGDDPPPQWDGYLGEIEIYYSRAQVDRWRKIYTVLTMDFGIPPQEYIEVPETRLEGIVSLKLHKTKAEELIGQAKTVPTSRDWRDVMAEEKGEPSSYDCKHSYKNYRGCTKCGTKHELNIGEQKPLTP